MDMGHSRRRPLRALFGVVVMMALSSAGVVVASGGSAGAASIAGAITNVTITPTNPAPHGQVTTDISWCVPNGTAAGDTFTLTLPPQLQGLPSGFQLVDGTPAHNVIANAVI